MATRSMKPASASDNKKAAVGEREPKPPARYDDLRALFLNCTLKRSGEDSHTERLIHVAAGVMRANKVKVDRSCARSTWSWRRACSRT